MKDYFAEEIGNQQILTISRPESRDYFKEEIENKGVSTLSKPRDFFNEEILGVSPTGSTPVHQALTQPKDYFREEVLGLSSVKPEGFVPAKPIPELRETKPIKPREMSDIGFVGGVSLRKMRGENTQLTEEQTRRNVALEQSFMKGLAGIEKDNPELAEEHPVISAIGEGVGELAGLTVAGGAVAGIGKKIIQEGIKRFGITQLPKIFAAARAAQVGSAFGVKETTEKAIKPLRGEEIKTEDLGDIIKDTAFGVGLGTVGSIPKPLLRIPAEALYGFTTAKIQGASNTDAAVSGAVFGLFGLLNRADLTKDYKLIAINEVKNNLSRKVQELHGLGKTETDVAVNDFIYKSAIKTTGETDINKAFDKILSSKENSLKYFDELNTKIKSLKAKPRLSKEEITPETTPTLIPKSSQPPPSQEEHLKIIDFYQKSIKGTSTGIKIPIIEFKVASIQPELTKSIGSLSNDVFISSKVLKHIYDTRPKLTDFIVSNLPQLLDTTEIFKNVSVSGETVRRAPNSFIFVKRNGKNFATVIEVKNIEGRNEIVTVMTVPTKSIKKLEPFKVQVRQPGTTALELAPFRPSESAKAESISASAEPLPVSGFSALQATTKILPQESLPVKTQKPQAISGAEAIFGQRGQPIESETLPPSEQPKFIKKSEIIKELGKKLNIPIRKGHFRRPQAVGIYKPDIDVIRWKKGGVATISHEIGHFLDDNFEDLHNLIWKTHRKELEPLDYDQQRKIKRPNEGFSEYLRYWVTNQDFGIKKASNFHVDFMAWLDRNPEVKEILTKAKQDYLDFLRMPSVMKVKAQISFEKSEEGFNIHRFFDDLYNKTIDDLAPIERFVRLAQKKGIEIADEQNPYILARLLRGWAGKANHFLLNKTFDVTLNVNGKGLKEILEPFKDNLDDLSTYLVARRAPQLAKRKIETGISVKDALQAQKDLEEKYPKIKEIAEELYQYQDRVLNYALKSGLIDGQQFIKMRELNQDYVPFFRVFEELQKGGFMGQKIADVQSPIKKIKGSERDIVNPIESIIKNTYVFLQAAERNNVMRAMVTLAKKDPEIGRMFERIPTPMAKVLTLDLSEEIKNKLGLLHGGMKGLIDKMFSEMGIDPVVDIFRPSMFSPKESIVTVLFGGKKAYYWTDPEIYKAVKGLDEEEAGLLIKILSYPAQWLRAGATTLSPEFLIRNPARDQFSAFIYSKFGYLPLIDLVRGLFSLINRDDLYWKWVRSGGLQSMLVSMDRNYLKRNVEELFGARLREKINPLEWLKALSEWMEQGTRLGEFRKGVEKGASLKGAAFASREVTLDFARKGSKIKNLNRIIAFLNSNIQGLNKPIRSFRDAPGTTISRILLGITLPSILLYLLNKDDEQYKQIPQWQKDLFWITSIDTDNKELAPSGKIILRIPKPFEIGIIFGSLPERILEHINREDPKLLNSLADTILRGVSIGFIPTGLQPILENMTNYSFFRQRRLESLGLEKLLPEDRYSVFTHETTKRLGKLMGVSPVKMDNLIKGYTASAGELALDTLDFIISGGKRKLPLTLENAPLLRGFIVKEPIGSASEAIDRFYDNLDKATQATGSIKARMQKDEEVASIKRKYPEYKAASMLNTTAFVLSKQRKRINLLLDDEKMDDREKLEKVRAIAVLMTKNAQKANDLVEKIRRQSKGQ